MAYGTTQDDIFLLVDKELKEANKNNPLFSSDHEAISVIREEIEETRDALNEVESDGIIQWEYIKNNAPGMDIEFVYERMYEDAVNVIQEGIQVAAMARKAIASRRKVKEGTKNE